MEINTIHQGNALDHLKTVQAHAFNCCVTSPPYWGLRDYGVEKSQWEEVKYLFFGIEITVPAMECCLGLEEKPEWYIGHMVAIFREVKRTLKNDGTVWLNIGDSYCNATNFKEHTGQRSNRDHGAMGFDRSKMNFKGLKSKDLVGIPWMLAFALRGDGWYLRQDIIWSKPNPMPESVTDRCTKSHEYIFLLSKSNKYYCDMKSIEEPASWNTNERVSRASLNHKLQPTDKVNAIRGRKEAPASNGMIKNNESFNAAMFKMPDVRNKRSVWTVATAPYPDAHFATFPENLIVDCIKAGCPEDGLVLDFCFGAGTTGLVCRKLNRNYYGIEISHNYIPMSQKRLHNELGMFL